MTQAENNLVNVLSDTEYNEVVLEESQVKCDVYIREYIEVEVEITDEHISIEVREGIEVVIIC